MRGRLFVVGDVHGCADELGALLDVFELSAGDHVVFLGDYVDRGPAVRDVVEMLVGLRERTGLAMTFLRGNHEDMLLAFLGEGGRYADAFLHNGGDRTLASYGIPVDASGAEARNLLPASHLDFFRNLTLHQEEAGFLFVHAGLSPMVGLEKQVSEDLLWIREEFIRNRHVLPYTVFFGHTPFREVFWHLPYKVGLDTGCVYGGKLSAIEITSGELFQIRKGSTEVLTRSGEPELRFLAERWRTGR